MSRLYRTCLICRRLAASDGVERHSTDAISNFAPWRYLAATSWYEKGLISWNYSELCNYILVLANRDLQRLNGYGCFRIVPCENQWAYVQHWTKKLIWWWQLARGSFRLLLLDLFTTRLRMSCTTNGKKVVLFLFRFSYKSTTQISEF